MAKKSSSEKVLVIVESPAKARTIGKYLGPGFEVESSIGHIRDLPSTAAEIPAEIKDQPWSRLGVNVDEGFEPVYIVPNDKKAQVRKLRTLLKEASELYLATDEDREGEAIAWHLSEVLKPKIPVRRMVFDEITKSAITRAVNETREIDLRLVDAQEARRILDRLYGYEVSPVLWRKVKPKLSAGRVQSVATRLVVDRERARMAFKQAEYWDLLAELAPQGDDASFETKMIELGGKRVAIGKDFAETTGQLKKPDDVVLLNGDAARDLASKLEQATFAVSEIQQKPFTNRPYAPFITSTLQQEAGRKLRFGAQRTMRLAQGLYENGYITYMRTDSTTLSTQALSAARKQATELYGGQYVPDAPRTYKSKSKNAQEAHEAIRPAGETFRTPQDVKGELNEDQFKLYDLIWKRTIASQMKDAHGQRTTVRISATGDGHDTALFTVSGKVIEFAGFMRAYVEGSDDPSAELENQEKVLPPLSEGQQLDTKRIEPLEHFTQPPARYTEASLIRELEERGIGRPSTYASIIQTIQDRGYVFRKGTALVPTFTAFAVVNLLERHLPDLVDYDFTARMEDGLDGIANGDRERRPWLQDFYFGGGNGNHGNDSHNDTRVREVGLKAIISSSGDEIDPRAVSTIPIGKTEGGDEIVVRVGRYGPYVQAGDADLKANVPDDIPPDEITVERALALLEEAAQSDKVLGNEPETNKPVYIKSGRFGPYVQLGDPELTEKGNVKKGGKPKMASLWPDMDMATLTLEDALMLLSFPREVGTHPETNEVITAQDGRYGPYIKMGADSRSLADHNALKTVTLEEAIKIFKEPKRRGRGVASQTVIADLGKHPTSGDELQVKNGRFGPYVTDGTVNATVPKSEDPAKVTLERAVELIKAREDKLRDQGKDPRAPKAKKTTTKKTKKTTKAKKSTKKKTAKKSTKKAAKT